MKTYKWVFKETLFISQKLGITQMSINRWMNKKKCGKLIQWNSMEFIIFQGKERGTYWYTILGWKSKPLSWVKLPDTREFILYNTTGAKF